MVDAVNYSGKMPAMCPHCGGKGCEVCKGTGKIEVGFASGAFYTRLCTNPECGFENGGRIVKEGKSLEDVEKKCVRCGKDTVVWKFLGQV